MIYRGKKRKNALLTNQLLYQLSYSSVEGGIIGKRDAALQRERPKKRARHFRSRLQCQVDNLLRRMAGRLEGPERQSAAHLVFENSWRGRLEDVHLVDFALGGDPQARLHVALANSATQR